jgi:hypothetical protein
MGVGFTGAGVGFAVAGVTVAGIPVLVRAAARLLMAALSSGAVISTLTSNIVGVPP